MYPYHRNNYTVLIFFIKLFCCFNSWLEINFCSIFGSFSYDTTIVALLNKADLCSVFIKKYVNGLFNALPQEPALPFHSLFCRWKMNLYFCIATKLPVRSKTISKSKSSSTNLITFQAFECVSSDITVIDFCNSWKRENMFINKRQQHIK